MFKKKYYTAKDETSVGIGCSTTSNGIDNLPNITGYPIVGTIKQNFTTIQPKFLCLQ